MENLQEINHEKQSMMLTLDESEQTIRTLGTMLDQKKDNDLKNINKLQEDWKNLLKIAQTVEKDISGPVKNETDKTKEKIKKFEEQLKEYLMGLKKEPFYVYKTGIEDSLRRIQEVINQISVF